METEPLATTETTEAEAPPICRQCGLDPQYRVETGEGYGTETYLCKWHLETFLRSHDRARITVLDSMKGDPA